MRFRPDIKPPMWGPPEAVQYAVMVNAERMGIDPASIISVYPFWEGVGNVFDVSGQRNDTFSNGSWSNSSPVFNGTDSVITQSGEREFSGLSKLSIIADITPTSTTLFRTIVAKRGSGQTTFQFRICQNSGDSRPAFIWTSGSNYNLYNNVSTPLVTNNRRNMVACAFDWERPTSVNYYVEQNVLTVSRSVGSGTSPDDANVPITIGRRHDVSMPFQGSIHSLLMFSAALSRQQMFEAISAPYALLMPVSRPVYFDLSGGGGGSYTDDLVSILSTVANASDLQHYRATIDVLTQAGVAVSDVRGLVEPIISLAAAQASADDAQAYRDQAVTQALTSDGAQDAQAYRDQLAEVIIGSGALDDQKQGVGAAEALLTVATTAAQASAAQAYVEVVTVIAAGSGSLAEAISLVEQLGSTASAIVSASDRQLFLQNVAIVALSSASISEIGAYIDEVESVAAASASLTDVLVGSFVGRYLFVDYCRPRSFEDYASPRSFVDYCRPRGRTLQ